jgi:hypothetical protein
LFSFHVNVNNCSNGLLNLPQELKNDIVNEMPQLEERFFGLTRQHLQSLGYEIAE